ncbi:MAG: Hsp33 family molecular chaperone HslO, partial [Oscillospiraceae bacterium]|nr:Hsp33 family molecular chaperone HslO [Oscillospiraceae bacterium]
MEKALISLGPEELAAMIEEQGDVTLSCQFCDNDQHFTKAQLEQMLADMKK